LKDVTSLNDAQTSIQRQTKDINGNTQTLNIIINKQHKLLKWNKN